MEILNTAEEILDQLLCRDFIYEVRTHSLNDKKINVLDINVNIDGMSYQMQPILLESVGQIRKLMKKAWSNAPSSINDKDINANLSLKNDIIFSRILDSLTAGDIKLLDVGFYNTSLFNQIEKTRSNVDYTGLDVFHAKHNFNTIMGDIEDEGLSLDHYDVINLSMLLLNVCYPEKVLRLCAEKINKKGRLIINDINSKYYKACGVYRKIDNEWFFTRVIETKKTFFTIKQLGRKGEFIHAHHHFNLYKEIIADIGLDLIKDEEYGPNNDFLKKKGNADYQSFARGIKYPNFHLLVASKNE